jgi:hypothetical protein
LDAELSFQFLSGLDLVGLAGGHGVVGDGCFGDAQLAGDLGVGEVFEEELFDLFARGAGAVLGASGGGEFTRAIEEFGDLDFVAVEEAGGDEGDEVVFRCRFI